MSSSTVENYIKQIYLELENTKGAYLQMKTLADSMNVTPGTTTTMIKNLAKTGYVTYSPRKGSRLTDRGKQLALRMLRRHRLIELFLVKVLNLDWTEVHQEAHRLEHAVSDMLMKKIDDLLDNPTIDPHGDPIPSEKGKISAAPLKILSQAPVKEPLIIGRICDQEPDFLHFIKGIGLVPGALVEVESKDTAAGTITILVEGKNSVTLGIPAAEKILVGSEQSVKV